MKRSQEEAEVIIRLDFATKSAHISVCEWPAMERKLSKRYGDNYSKPSDMAQGVVRTTFRTIPLRCIRFGQLEKKKTGNKLLRGRSGNTPVLPQNP